ncbi:MAG: phage integrase family domain protein [Pseudarthrobacter sp.]|nr:phage integrase family domain protein [Pseudarthrobacter sp.]
MTFWEKLRRRFSANYCDQCLLKDLPEGFRFHDLRHYFASLLIAQGLDVKVVQKSLRHSSAKTTLDTYGHMWPDKEESARAAVSQVLLERSSLRTEQHG